MKCSVPGCLSVVENTTFNGYRFEHYCQKHLNKTNSKASLTQRNQLYENLDSSRSKSLIFRRLNIMLEKIKESKSYLIKNICKIISSLKDRSKLLILELDKHSSALKKIIEDLNIQGGPDNPIKALFKQSESRVKKVTDSWVSLFKFSHNEKTLIKEIQTYGEVELNIDQLYLSATSSQDESQSISELSQVIKLDESITNDLSLRTKPAPTIKRASSRLNLTNEVDLLLVANRPKKDIKTMKCSRNHKMTWNNFITFSYFEKSGNIYIECNQCKTTFSASCWTCFECPFYRCENCGNNQGFKSPKPECNSGHELIWRPDIYAFYYSEKQMNGFKCRSCKNSKIEPSWHCQNCRFDICRDCGKKIFNILAFSLTPSCNNQHALSLKIFDPSTSIESIICSQCKQSILENSSYCQKCDYFLCNPCSQLYSLPAAGHPILSCRKHHVMVWTSGKVNKCFICFRDIYQKSYQCLKCLTNICSACAFILVKSVTSGIEKYCSKHHILRWMSNSLSSESDFFKCSYCREYFYNAAGMFYCEICRVDFCAPCYEKLVQMNRRKVSLVTKLNTMNVLVNKYSKFIQN